MPVGFKSRAVGPLVLVLLAGIWFGACAPQASVSGYEQLNDEIREELQLVGLGVGDVFSVNVYGEKELSGEHQISPEGTVDVPLVGRVEVQGKTPSEIARVLEERFLAGYLKAPYVSVYVKQYNSKKIFVLGMVRKPGTFPLTAGMNVVCNRPKRRFERRNGNLPSVCLSNCRAVSRLGVVSSRFFS